MRRFLLALIVSAVGCMGGQELEYRQIIQAVLDAPKLQQYFHPGLHGRTPLILSSENVPNAESLSLQKFGRPVRVLSKKEINQHRVKAFVEVVDFAIQNDQANVTVVYAVEGVRLRTVLLRNKGNWILSESHLVEQ